MKVFSKKNILVSILLVVNLVNSNNPILAANRTIKKTNNKVWMKGLADHVGFCATFASRVVLHNFRCNQSPENCEIPSILRMIETVTKHFPLEARDDINAILEAAKAEGKIESETCLEFGEYFKIDKAFDQKDFNSTYMHYVSRIVSPHTKSEIIPLCKCYGSCQAVPMNTLKELSYKIFYDEVGKAILSKKCQTKPIPNFEVKSELLESLEQVDKVLEQGHSVILPLNIWSFDKQIQAPHAVAVVNYREVCLEENVCLKEYQVVDSLDHYWAENRDGWVYEDDLNKNLKKPISFTWVVPVAMVP